MAIDLNNDWIDDANSELYEYIVMNAENYTENESVVDKIIKTASKYVSVLLKKKLK